MAIIERRIDIDAAPGEVFGYVTDFPRHSEWAAHDLQVEPTGAGPLAVGSTYASKSHLMGQHIATIDVTELDPDRRVVFECEDNTGRYRHFFQVEDRDGATQLVKGMEPLRMSLMFKLASPLMPLIVGRGFDSDLKRIKERIEAPGA